MNRLKFTMTKKQETMKKHLFKTRLLSFAALCGIALTFASCAKEDVAQNTTGTEGDNDKNLTTFVAGGENKTRTSLDYNSSDFYWEAGDKIYVKDDDGAWQVSDNAPTAKTASFKFKVPGKFKNSSTYKVYYPGKNSSHDQVTIPSTQTQAEPNVTTHLGESGDCGIATATGTLGGNSFSFQLEHQAAVLVFEPYTTNNVFQRCYLTKIEVLSDKNIAGTYTLDPTTGELTGTGTSKKIVLNTVGTGSYADGFSLNSSTADPTVNGAYMTIQPGMHTLHIRYWIKDKVTGLSGSITKVLPAFNYKGNYYYDLAANFDTRVYSGRNYYQVDAEQNYWYGHEWDSADPWQPTTVGETSHTPSGSYITEAFPNWSTDYSRTPLFTTPKFPTLNGIVWYIKKGDPRWDTDEIWVSMGHIYKGGMWFKKRDNIPGFSDTEAPDGLGDMRTYNSLPYSLSSTPPTVVNNTLNLGIPQLSEIDQYFYLPTLGKYNFDGTLFDVGQRGYYHLNGRYVDAAAHHMAEYLVFEEGKAELGLGGVGNDGEGYIARLFE